MPCSQLGPSFSIPVSLYSQSLPATMNQVAGFLGFGQLPIKVINPDGRFRVISTKPMPGDRWIDVLVKADCRVEVSRICKNFAYLHLLICCDSFIKVGFVLQTALSSCRPLECLALERCILRSLLVVTTLHSEYASDNFCTAVHGLPKLRFNILSA